MILVERFTPQQISSESDKRSTFVIPPDHIPLPANPASPLARSGDVCLAAENPLPAMSVCDHSTPMNSVSLRWPGAKSRNRCFQHDKQHHRVTPTSFQNP
jgi:hypothetical protein